MAITTPMRLRVRCCKFANQDPHPGFALSQRILGAAALADIDEGHDDAVDLVLDGAVRLEPREIPAAILAMHLALGRSEIAQNLACVRRRGRRSRGDG